MDSAFIIICALILNALLAGPRSLYERLGVLALLHFPAKKLREVERKLNREHRPERELEMRGYIVLASGLCAATAIGWLLGGVTLASGKLFDVVVLAVLLPVRPIIDFAHAVKKSLRQNNIPEAREVFSHTTWRHHAVMDEYSLARAAIETLAVHFVERIVSPLLFYIVLGLPGALACIFITMLHDTVSGGAFSIAAKNAYAIAQWLPSRFAACLWIAASLFLPEGKIKHIAAQLWPLMATDAPQPLALSCAGHVMNISLGGPASVYSGGNWLGNGTPKILHLHIGKALYLFAIIHILLIVILGLVL
ncbi:MAG: cobalamin biosynthesis protein [Alphaproteobacteria bacterium]